MSCWQVHVGVGVFVEAEKRGATEVCRNLFEPQSETSAKHFLVSDCTFFF